MLDYDDCFEAVPTQIIPEKIIYRNKMPSNCDDLDVTFGLKYTAEGHRVDWQGVIQISCGERLVEALCESQSSTIEPRDLPAEMCVSLQDMFAIIADVGSVSVETYLTGMVLEWLDDDFIVMTRVKHDDEVVTVEITFWQEGVERFGFEAEMPIGELLPDEEGLRKADATAAFLARHGL